MALCDPLHCKFWSAAPCFAEGSGSLGALFCCFSKPRCKFCGILYGQQMICPWHWLKKGQKVKHIGKEESCIVGGVMGVAGNWLAAPVLFLALGSACFRRDGNQFVKGGINFILFYLGFSSIFVFPPLALVVLAFMFLASPAVDWFVIGRCDDCWHHGCGCCLWCCFPEQKAPEGQEQASEERSLTKNQGKAPMRELESATPPQHQEITQGGEAKYGGRAMQEPGQEDEEDNNPDSTRNKAAAGCGMCCCFLMVAFVVGMLFLLKEYMPAVPTSEWIHAAVGNATDAAQTAAGSTGS